MFKKFTREEDISSLNTLKSSVARSIRQQLQDQYPFLDSSGLLDALLPKKESYQLAKCSGYTELLILNKTPLFFRDRDGPWLPTLRLLHQYPQIMLRLRTDKGAIRFVLGGANIMCPGFTSPGATIHDEIGKNKPVSIYAEDKEYAMAIGVTSLSTEEIKSVNKGIGVQNCHYLNDGLWKLQTIE